MFKELGSEMTSSHSAGAEVAALIVKFSRVSSALSPADVVSLQQLVEALKLAQRQTIIERVQAEDCRVLLLQYSADLTPAVIKKAVCATSSEVAVKRTASRCEEFLVQHLLVSFRTRSGDLETLCYHSDPVILKHGKAMHALLGVSSVFPLMGQFPAQQHRFRIYHQVYDRGVGTQFIHALSGQWG